MINAQPKDGNTLQFLLYSIFNSHSKFSLLLTKSDL